MFIIDTNILAAEVLTLHEKDKLTTSYLAFYKQLPLMKRVISDFILNEFETFMMQVVPSRYRLSDGEKQNLRNITNAYLKKIIDGYTIITPTTTTVKEAFSLYQQNFHTHYINFTDSLMLTLAKHHHFTIISRDERLNARAKELMVAYYKPRN